MPEKVTKQNIRTGQFFQIILPFLVILGGFIYLIVFMIQGSNQGVIDLRMVGDISSVYLIFFVLSGFFVTLLMMVGVVVLTGKGTMALKSVFPKVKHFAERASEVIQRACDIAVRPFIEVEARTSILKGPKKGKNDEE